MFEYVKGKLSSITPSKIVIDVGGIGYAISIALSTYARLPQVGSEVQFFVAPIIREDAHLLYGFLSQGDRDLFYRLNSVSGIGPKTALALIGHMATADLEIAILHGNVALLSKVPGIGKKTAERLVIELRDKIKLESSHAIPAEKGVIADAISALINLGYHPASAQKAVKEALAHHKQEPVLGQLITSALRAI